MHTRLLICLFAGIGIPALAQFPEDALRLAAPGVGIGARAVGMGSAFLPVADDYSALFWNPAGLAQIGLREVSFGLSNVAYGSDAQFQSLQSSSSLTSLQIEDIGAVIPVRRSGGGLSFAIGYNRISNFSAVTSFAALNQASSLIDFEVKNAPSDVTQSLPYLTSVAGIVGGKLVTPVHGGLHQDGSFTEKGGVHALSAGLGAEIASGLDIGAALHFYTGGYDYQREFTESDINNLYTAQDSNWNNVDLARYSQSDNVSSTITGFGATLGLLYRLQDLGSFGLTVAVPSAYHVYEDYSSTARATFDNGEASNLVTQPGYDEYNVTTPMTISGGAAVHPLNQLTISGSVDYIDYTLLEFSNADPAVLAYNADMRTIFRPTLNYRLGAEYKIAPLGIGVRGGYQFFQSAYASDAAGEGQKILSFGFSAVLAHKALLELAYAHGMSNSMHVIYDATASTTEKVSLHTFMLSFGYRF